MSEFGRDPAAGQQKNCFCATAVAKPPVPPLHTEKTHIVDSNGEHVTLSCANWSGSQLESFVPGGLDKVPLDMISKTIASLGFNCVRLPYSLQLYLENPTIENKYVYANPSLFDNKAMQVFDKTVRSLTDTGLMVIVNNHVSGAGKCCSTTDSNGMWYNKDYPEDRYFEVLRAISARYAGNKMVVGNDLRNELRPDETTGLMPVWGSGL